jgi:hypothetical protein
VSSHIWNVKRFTKHTVDNATFALDMVLKHSKHGMLFAEVCTLLGYALESSRQKGNSKLMITHVILNCLHGRRKLTYSEGVNKDNYYEAGRRLLETQGYRVQLEDAPAEAVWDALLEALNRGDRPWTSNHQPPQQKT